MGKIETPRIRHPLWNIWRGIKKRCDDPKNSAYKWYGGKGVIMCERWHKSFKDFCADMNPRPYLNYSIDRIDSSGNYEPSNCRWIHQSLQHNNKSSNVIVEFKGEKRTLKQWAQHVGIDYGVIQQRYRNNGWTFERSITQPVHFKPRKSK